MYESDYKTYVATQFINSVMWTWKKVQIDIMVTFMKVLKEAICLLLPLTDPQAHCFKKKNKKQLLQDLAITFCEIFFPS